MTSTEIAAYLGAAAWLPQIGWLVYLKCVTANVILVPEASVEIGYTRFGPIFNLRVALTSDRKDAVIDKIEAVVRHEDGDEHILTWVGLRESISEILNPDGNRQFIEKDQPAIALRLSTLNMLEKFIRFQEERFHGAIGPAQRELGLCYSATGDVANRGEAVLRSKEFLNVMDTYRTQFWWRAGNYTVAFKVSSPKRVTFEKTMWRFHIEPFQADALRQNLSEVEKEFRNISHGQTPDYQPDPVTWNWQNARLTRVART